MKNNTVNNQTVKTVTASDWFMVKFNESYQPVAYKNFVAYRLFMRKVNNTWVAVPSFAVNCVDRINLLDTFEINTEDAKTFLVSCKDQKGNRIPLVSTAAKALNNQLGLN